VSDYLDDTPALPGRYARPAWTMHLI